MNYKIAQKISLLSVFLFAGIAFLSPHFFAEAQTISELEQQIQDRAGERSELERQADNIRFELTQVGAERGTLQAELNRINAERKSLDNTIEQTENEINSLTLKIDKSEQEISRYNSEIQTHAGTLAALLRGANQRNTLSFLEILISGEKFSDFFSVRDSYTRIQEPLLTTTELLEQRKVDLRKTNRVLALEQEQLEEEKNILGGQRSIVQSKESEQASVVSRAREKENSTKQSLSATLATIAALDAEIRDFESKLQFILNPDILPQKGSEVFAWPLKSVLVTQRFGRTVSSERLYVSGSHSGVDFRAAVGTPVYAVADGTVVDVGNTDDQCFRASFGKWVFIHHDVGLSTTSGHLSSQVVRAGQRVKKGDLIGYSGNTGRSTAPHLHLTVYATEGVDGGQGARITNRPSAACPGSNYIIPLAPTAAYLDPLAYLPATNSSFFKHN